MSSKDENICVMISNDVEYLHRLHCIRLCVLNAFIDIHGGSSCICAAERIQKIVHRIYSLRGLLREIKFCLLHFVNALHGGLSIVWRRTPE